MTLEKLLQVTDAVTGTPDDFIRAVTGARGKSAYWDAAKEYNPKEHKVMSKAHRPDKPLRRSTGKKDAMGNDIKETYGYEPVNRVPLPIQQHLVKQAAAFMAGNGVTLSAPTETDEQKMLLQAVRKFLDNNKMDFRNRDIARRLLSETEVAEVWHSRRDEAAVDLRCKIYSPSMGCELFPVFDDEEDLIAFGIQRHSQLDKKGVFVLYTKDEMIRYENSSGTWEEVKRTALPYGKIPVIYYQIPEPDWAIVQPLIERLEKILSNFGDTNDYHASPTLVLTGKVTGLANKGETGKALQLDAGAKAEYVTWEGAPEAIKLEIETLLKFIYMFTQTINFSSEEMKGLGSAGISGAAWDKIMTPANLKASDYQDGVFGEGIQRRINFLKAAVAQIPKSGVSDKLAGETPITPVFSLFRPDDLAERVELYMKASGGQAVMTLEEAIQGVGVSRNIAETAATIKEEQAQRAPAISANPVTTA